MIEFRNISKIYHLGGHEVRALDDVSFQIKDAEMVALMGASGSGKSTAMNILGLLDRPTGGAYYLNQKEVSTLSSDELARLRNHTIGFVFQSFFLLPRLTAIQNVSLPLTYTNMKTSEIKERALSNLQKVGMDRFVDHKPNQLSGGQQQRVAIARALITDPDVIFADEPTGALDSKTGQDVMNLLISIHRDHNATIIIVTHDPLVAEQCQRVIRLKDGKVISQ